MVREQYFQRHGVLISKGRNSFYARSRMQGDFEPEKECELLRKARQDTNTFLQPSTMQFPCRFQKQNFKNMGDMFPSG
jgi:hypothetical protein